MRMQECFGPDDLRVMQSAFDDASTKLGYAVSDDRHRLARAIIQRCNDGVPTSAVLAGDATYGMMELSGSDGSAGDNFAMLGTVTSVS